MHSSGHWYDCLSFLLCYSIERSKRSKHIHTHVVRFVKCVLQWKFCARSRSCTHPAFEEENWHYGRFFLLSYNFYWLERRVHAGKERKRKTEVQKRLLNRLLLHRCRLQRCLHWSCAALCEWRMRILFGIYSISIEIYSFFLSRFYNI